MVRSPVIVCCLMAFAASLSVYAASSKDKVDFNRDVRPILAENCFTCHGPDEGKRKAGLRLDKKEFAFKPAKSGDVVIIPGKAAESELFKRITHKDEDERMPPSKQLLPAQIETLKKWIAQGAEYKQHWAFTAPERAEPPKAKDKKWARNGIDNFVLARLDAEKLKPSPEASKETLIRRATLDLTGIPPTPEEINAFLADKAPDAYERVLDRLLVSPRYGERMALDWLDYARFADSNGYQDDSSRYMWPWREWVIKAFNNNMHFDQFTVEQLAGDLLPNPTNDQLVATGFNRNHRLNGEGGIIGEEWRVETVIDRVETTGMTWMALTVMCCRCHDHKYDPITQKEFFQLFSFFNNVPESGTSGGPRNTDPITLLPDDKQKAEMARLEGLITEAQKNHAELQKQLPALAAKWEEELREKLKGPETWAALQPKEVTSQGGATFTKQADGSWLASGKNAGNDSYTIKAPLAAGNFSGVLLEVFPDDSLPNKSLGRAPNGNFVLSGFEAEIAAPNAPAVKVTFTRAEADYSQINWEIAKVLDGKKETGWAVDGHDPAQRLPRKAMFVAAAPVSVPPDATLTVLMKHEAAGEHNIGRFRLAVSAMEPAFVQVNGIKPPPNIVAIMDTAADKRTPQQTSELQTHFLTKIPNPIKGAETAVSKAQQTLVDYKMTVPSCMVMREMDKPRDAFQLKRGQYDKPGDKVTAGLPAVMPPMPEGQPMNRLGLAKWLTSAEHPLTARVWVNRQWERFFGTGIVKTSENFGMQAEWPSHLELLDWLATEFVRLNWDMKATQKLIMMSATYRQSSKVTPQMVERDPENRLLARGPRFRLPAEIIRDQALAVSGLLVEKIGGPSVRPYMPQGVWDETSVYGNLRNYDHDKGDGLYRRSIYTIWKRTAAPPQMLMFDAPGRETCVVKRSRTNTPLQALTLMNEVTYVEAARALAQRMLTNGGSTPEERINYAFRLATSRQPTKEETSVLTTGLLRRLEKYKNKVEDAKKVIAQGESKPDPKLDPAELTAYTITANVILNLDETITKE